MSHDHTPPWRRRRKRWTVGAAAVAATLALPATSLAQTDPEPTPETTETPREPAAAPSGYRLRARVTLRPNGSSRGPLTLPAAMRSARKMACRRTKKMLASGEPKRSKVKVVLFREEGATDATRSSTPSVSCQSKQERIAAFKLKSRTAYPKTGGARATRGPIRLQKAVRILVTRTNAASASILESGGSQTFALRLKRKPKSVAGMIRGLGRRYNLDVGKALAVARCESGLNPRAHNPAGYGGVFQQPYSYWARRARYWGHPGESIYDPFANVDVTLRAVKHQGWVGWGCA